MKRKLIITAIVALVFGLASPTYASNNVTPIPTLNFVALNSSTVRVYVNGSSAPEHHICPSSKNYLVGKFADGTNEWRCDTVKLTASAFYIDYSLPFGSTESFNVNAHDPRYLGDPKYLGWSGWSAWYPFTNTNPNAPIVVAPTPIVVAPTPIVVAPTPIVVAPTPTVSLPIVVAPTPTYTGAYPTISLPNPTISLPTSTEIYPTISFGTIPKLFTGAYNGRCDGKLICPASPISFPSSYTYPPIDLGLSSKCVGICYGVPSQVNGLPRNTYVSGYFRSNGTWVNPYTRSKP